MSEPERRPIHCVCCPPGRREVLAMVEGSRVIIQGLRHGRRHTAVLEGMPAHSDTPPAGDTQ